MITIHLHKLIFYGYHGVHEEEKILGNVYEVNVDVQFHEGQQSITSLCETINYVDIFEIIKQRMLIPTNLLETIVMDIGNTIHQNYNYVNRISISLNKMHPPISSIRGNIGVTWQKDF